jgi:hypothetical protein
MKIEKYFSRCKSEIFKGNEKILFFHHRILFIIKHSMEKATLKWITNWNEHYDTVYLKLGYLDDVAGYAREFI